METDRIEDSPPAPDAPKGGRAGLVLKLLALAVIIALLVVYGRRVSTRFGEFAEYVEGLGEIGMLIFMGGYVIATVAFIPASLLTLAAGAIYGVLAGSILVFGAATTGSCAAFLISRYVARGAVEKRLAGNPRFAAIDRAIGERGFYITFLLRLSPIFPFNALNYGLGLTRVRFRDFALASVGMIPGTIIYTYYGAAAGTIASITSDSQATTGGTAKLVFFVGGLVATIIVTVIITRAARRALKEATDAAEEPDPTSG